MPQWQESIRRLTYLFRRSRFDPELDAELQFHIEARADDLAQSGTPRAAALAQARRELGSSARMREDLADPSITPSGLICGWCRKPGAIR